MINKFELKGVHLDVDDNLKRYATKKIGRLDRYMPRRWRDSVHAMVELKEGRAKDQNRYSATVLMKLPHGSDLTVTESTVNIYAAIDIVETKLKQQIKKYKEMRPDGKHSRRLAAYFRRRTSEE